MKRKLENIASGDLSNETTKVKISKQCLTSETRASNASVDIEASVRPLFSFHTTQSFDRNFPYYRPMEIGCYSLDDQRCFVDNNSRLRYIARSYVQDKSVRYDLNEGYETWISRDVTKYINEKLDNLLHWIMRHRDRFVCGGASAGSNRDDATLNGKATSNVSGMNGYFYCY